MEKFKILTVRKCKKVKREFPKVMPEYTKREKALDDLNNVLQTTDIRDFGLHFFKFIIIH